jgi:serine/threonine protein kinase
VTDAADETMVRPMKTACRRILKFGDGWMTWCRAQHPEELTEQPTRSADSLTEAGQIVGTLHYLSPEVLRGRAADMRTDVWALGVLLYELATGERPFQGQTKFEVTSAILEQPPRPLPDRVPAGLRSVIERCLAKEPSERYQRCSEYCCSRVNRLLHRRAPHPKVVAAVVTVVRRPPPFLPSRSWALGSSPCVPKASTPSRCCPSPTWEAIRKRST